MLAEGYGTQTTLTHKVTQILMHGRGILELLSGFRWILSGRKHLGSRRGGGDRVQTFWLSCMKFRPKLVLRALLMLLTSSWTLTQSCLREHRGHANQDWSTFLYQRKYVIEQLCTGSPLPHVIASYNQHELLHTVQPLRVCAAAVSEGDEWWCPGWSRSYWCTSFHGVFVLVASVTL